MKKELKEPFKVYILMSSLLNNIWLFVINSYRFIKIKNVITWTFMTTDQLGFFNFKPITIPFLWTLVKVRTVLLCSVFSFTKKTQKSVSICVSNKVHTSSLCSSHKGMCSSHKLELRIRTKNLCEYSHRN
jgi:hypothetical protein